MACPPTLSPIVANTSSPDPGDHSVNYSTSRRTCQLHTILKQMVRPNESTRYWNSIFESTSTTSRTTGFTFYPLPRSHTTTQHIQPRMSLLSSPIRGSTPNSKFPSSLFHRSMLTKWLQTSRSCTSTFRASSSIPSSGISFTPWTVDCPSRTSKSGTLCGWTLETSRQSVPRRNWTITSSVHFQLWRWSHLMQSDWVYHLHSSTYTQSFMSHFSSLNSQVRFPTASMTHLCHWRLTTLMNMRSDGSSTAKSIVAEKDPAYCTWSSGLASTTPRSPPAGSLRNTCGMPLTLSGHSTRPIPISPSLN